METTHMLVIAATCTGGLAACFALIAAIRLASVQSRVEAARRHAVSDSIFHRIVRNGFSPLVGLSQRLLALPYWNKFCLVLANAARERGVETTTVSVASLVSGVCIGAGLVSIASHSVVALGVVAVALIAVYTYAASMEERRHAAMRESLPDALRAMASCFHAGFTLPQTFEQLQRETTGPLKQVFARTKHAMETGHTAQEALTEMRLMAGIPELSFVAVALEVQHESGGSMQHVLDATSDMLKSELELRRSLKVQTAQARLSARVVVAVTVGLVVVLMSLTENFLEPFFSSVAGMVLLSVAIGMQVLGIAIVRRMLKVEVA